MIPRVSNGVLKLISNPTSFPESFRYVRSWASWTWKNPLDRLQLDDHFITDDQIYFVSAIELQPLIRNRKIDLALEGQPTKVKFITEGLFVREFQQARSELAMDFDRRSND
jgi:hypothetical protein